MKRTGREDLAIFFPLHCLEMEDACVQVEQCREDDIGANSMLAATVIIVSHSIWLTRKVFVSARCRTCQAKRYAGAINLGLISGLELI